MIISTEEPELAGTLYISKVQHKGYLPAGTHTLHSVYTTAALLAHFHSTVAFSLCLACSLLGAVIFQSVAGETTSFTL